MIRYQFCTKETEDCRPLKPAKWYVSCCCDEYYVLICYLRDDDNIFDYWEDAFSIIKTKVEP